MRRQPCVAEIAIALTALFLSSAAVPAGDGGGMARIDPAVLAALETKGEATFWVAFREEADLGPAIAIRDWNQRGRFVHERLVATAEASQARVRALLAASGAEMRPFWIANVIEVRTANSALPHLLAAQPEVAEIAAPPEIEPIVVFPGVEQPPTESIGWNIGHIRAHLVWSYYGVTGEGAVVGSIDGGVEYDHPALVEHYRGNLGGGVFDHNYNWYDPTFKCGNPSIEPCDPDGHGTATTSIAVGDDGGDNQIGVAPGARFIMAAVDWTPATVLAAMQWMMAPTDLNGQNPRPDLRPHVVNNSWGYTTPSTYFQAAVQAWLASGIFPVFAVGNSGPGCGTTLIPAGYLETYAVGAHDSNNFIASFSSRGPSSFGGIKPDIVAPGVDIRMAYPVGTYVTFSATSFSTPHVTGTVALMVSLNPELVGKPETVRLHLDHAAIDRSDLTCEGDPGNNNVWGEGRLDAFNAASFLLIDGVESGDTSAWSAVVP